MSEWMSERRQVIFTGLAMLGLWTIVGTIEKCDAEAARGPVVYDDGEDPWGWEPQ